MPEMKKSFQKGRMNKDLDERLVPQGEYRDALNVQVTTSDGSDVGSLQTLRGNTVLSNLGTNLTCIGSATDEKNDKIYWMVSGPTIDMIVEFDYVTGDVVPVCVDKYILYGRRSLNFNPDFLITGLNIMDGFIFWTDNNSEPKKINIRRGKAGSSTFNNHTFLMVKDVDVNAPPNSLVFALDVDGQPVPIKEEHLTVIKKGPDAAPVLEMIDTTVGDWDGDGNIGGAELLAPVTNAASLTWLDGDGEFVPTITIQTSSGTDFPPNSYLNVFQESDKSVKARLKINGVGGPIGYSCTILSGNKDIAGEEDLMVELEQDSSLFEFKFVRFAYRYKYEDGEYSPYSPFTQPAFLPGGFSYLPKQGYNLGMVNRLRQLAIKDFVHTRSMPEDVVSIDILYKESNSPNVYSVKTIKRRGYNPNKWDEWNAVSEGVVVENGVQLGDGWAGRTKGYLPITTEMIHATLPSNQLLRPWDNVPRKALAQEIVGNRLVYGNYLQNYNLSNSDTNNVNIKVDLKVQLRSRSLGNILPEEIEAGPNRRPLRYSPSKSLKSLRTYQLGVVYIDQYGRETPVFSEDKRGQTSSGTDTSQASIYIPKEYAPKRNSLIVELKNDPPDWATHFKLFVKETSNEYYNLAMDRWYEAEDGNIWLSFPSAERNKVDEETFLILKKAHDSGEFIEAPARYKIIAIENEAPRFIKLQNVSQGGIVDSTTSGVSILGLSASGFPLEGGFFIYVDQTAFEEAGWKDSLINQDISQCFMRVKSASGISNYYRLKQITYDSSTGSYYKMESDKVFGPDMAHTSPDGTFLNRITNCELQVIKRIPEDKAEFEGRFFVKVLKDDVLIKSLNITPNTGLDYIAIASMQVQYINPLAAQANGGWDGFGQNKWRISIDKRQDDYWARPGGDLAEGDGQNFWKHAADDTATNNLNSVNVSSGWFIDAVEGFRPYNGDWYGKTIGTRSDKAKTTPNVPCYAGFGPVDDDFNDGLTDRIPHAMGLNTYGTTGNNYLGTSGTQSIKSPNGVMQDTSVSLGPVAKPVGIDPTTGIINISYAGLNEDGDDGSMPSGTWADNLTTHYFNDAAKHAADELFIGKLLTPGSIWRWKEDPDQVLYKTVAMTGLSATSTPYTSAEWTNEAKDTDGNPGIILFNYINFSDYMITSHYIRVKYCTSWPANLAPNAPYQDTDYKTDWVTRNIGNHNISSACCLGCVACGLGGSWVTLNLACSLTWGTGCSCNHCGVKGSNTHGGFFGGSCYEAHYKFPNLNYDWDISKNKRRRFRFKAETLDDPTIPLGGTGHNYLPTNNPTFAPHFNASATAISIDPITGVAFTDPAPGIRPDGMHTGYTNPVGWTWNNGSTTTSETLIPQYKRWSADSTPVETPAPGSVTWEIVEPFTPSDEKFSSTNPAIWETEPKEDVGMDIYHEIGHKYPIYLNDNTIEQFVGAVHEDISKNSYVHCWDGGPPMGNSTGTISLSTGSSSDIRIYAVKGRYVQLADLSGNILDDNNASHQTPIAGSYLIFYRADGGVTEAHVGPGTYNNNGTWYELVGNYINNEVGVHSKMIELPFFNCYSFGNGVESDRIRDDYNQVTIDNGPKASTTLEEPYLEDRRKSGFIWSGIYNSKSGVNNLNQFIQAEAITKDANPVYGSIQKMHVRDNDLVAFCEDRVLKVLANKDALFNADGNTNLVATNRVLGNIRPFVGDYGISTNPESFASDSYRSYFSDTSRGAIVRLSQDGLSAISNFGMKNWFSRNLPLYSKIIGSFDDNKNEYNITLKPKLQYSRVPKKTLSFNEPSNGWTSFKSFIKESGLSLNNSYYTFFGGDLWLHHDNEVHNNFYGVQYESSVDVLFNDAPGVVKSFQTLNYEGTQARVTADINNNPDYYDNFTKTGWWVEELNSDVQQLGIMEFWDKEDRWFSQIKGVATEWLNDGTAGNIDPREFSYQGIGNAYDVECEDCPDVVSWVCQTVYTGATSTYSCNQINGPGGYATQQQCLDAGCGTQESYNCTEAGCVDPEDGTGQFSTFCECVDSRCCPESQAYFFDCQNISAPSNVAVVFGCMDDGITNDPWITQDRPAGWVGPATNYYAGAQADDCSCIYQTASTWDCVSGSCIEVFNGNGQFASEAICLQNCQAPCGRPFVTSPAQLTHIISNVIGGCNNGNYPSTGEATLGITNDPINPTDWILKVFDSNSVLLYTSNILTGPINDTVSNLAPGVYTYNIADVNTNCDYDYTFEILCEDPPPPTPITFNCDTVSNTCIDPGDGSGTYTGPNAYTDCINDPASPCNPNYQYGGCTDPCACNWDPNASFDDGSCIYDCDSNNLTNFSAGIGYQNQINAGIYSATGTTGIPEAMVGLTGLGGNTTCIDCGGPGVNLANQPYFVNNETIIEAFVRTHGIDADMRDYVYNRAVSYNSSSVKRYMNLRVSNIDLNGWYNSQNIFFKWRDYIDSAVATGVISNVLNVIDPNCTGSPCINDPQNFDPTTGYVIRLNKIRQAITTGMQATNVWTCDGTVSTWNQNGIGGSNTANCDRTHVTLCDPCTVPPSNPCGPGPSYNYICYDGNVSASMQCSQTVAPVGVNSQGTVYASQQDCLSNCQSDNYICSHNYCVPTTLPLGTSNVYPSLADCQASNCGRSQEIQSWNCVNGTCVYDPTGAGPYSTLTQCQLYCAQLPSNWACEGGGTPQAQCVQTASQVNGTTVFANQQDCLDNCNTVAPADISWGGCCHPSAMEYSYIGPNGLACHADTMCTCFMDPFNCTLPTCFVGGTQVTMLDGSSKNIENVVIGDIVRSYNEYTKELSDAVVIKTQSQTAMNTVKLGFGDISIQNTFDHPYYVENKGWSVYDPKTSNHDFAVSKLEIGDVCYVYNKDVINKTKLTNVEEVVKDVTTYIFTLDKDKAFFANNILVHNKA